MILWMTPTQRDYVPLPGPIAGLGTLHSAPYSELIKVAQEVLDRVSAGTLRDRALIVWRVPPLRLLLQRLEYVPTTLRRVQLGVREAQRYILELIAAADWYEKYEPRLKLPAPPSWSMVPARTIGAFTNNLTDCDSLFRMGLPVWLIRPWEALPSIRVQKTLDTIEHKALYPEEPASRPSHRAIFIGAATDPRKYSAIYDFSVSHFLYADPFGTVRAPPAALAPAVVSQTEKALQREIKRQAYSPCVFQFNYLTKNTANSILTDAQNKKGKGPAQPQAGRNKFEDPVNPIYPPAIPSWSLALLNVQQGTTRFKPGTSNETDTGYVFPEPAGFITLDSDDRRRSFFRSWLKLRPLLIFRMSSEDFEQAKPMKAQAWRELLGLDFLNNRPDPPSTPGSSSSSKPNKSHGKKSRSNDQAGPSSTPGQSKSQRLRAMMAKFLEGCLDAADTDLREEVESNAVSWNGADFDAMESRHFEEVLWELAELNFRFELAALDARMSASTVTERRHLVAQCFPDVKQEGSLLVVKLECADQGLGSLHWEQRARYLHALKCLMMTWKAGAVPEIIKQDSKILWKAAELDVLEEEITKLYTQEFYDHFRRAPRSLPSFPCCSNSSSFAASW